MSDPTSSDDARKAVERAERQLREQFSLWGAVHRRVASLRSLAEDNHFTERIIQAMRGELS